MGSRWNLKKKEQLTRKTNVMTNNKKHNACDRRPMLAEPQLLVALVLAHLLADFIFNRLPGYSKETNDTWHTLIPTRNCSILGSSNVLVFINDSIASIGIGAIIVAVSHFKIDGLNRIVSKTPRLLLSIK